MRGFTIKMTRYSEPKILGILRQAEGGVPVAELCREHGRSNASFYKYRAACGGMDVSMLSQSGPCPPFVRGQWRAPWKMRTVGKWTCRVFVLSLVLV